MSLIARMKKGETTVVADPNKTRSLSLEKKSDSSRLSSSSQHAKPEPHSSASFASRPQKYAFKDLEERIQDKLVAELDPRMDVSRTDEVRRTIQDMYDQLLQQESIILSRSEREQLFENIT